MFGYHKMHWYLAVVLISLLAFDWFSYKPDATLTEKVAGQVGIVFLWLVLMLVYFAAWKIITRFTGRRFRGSIGPHTFEIGEDTFAESNAQGRQEIKVAGLRRVAETASHFIVLTNTGTGYVIPKRDLQNYEALYELQKKVAGRGA